jgi:glycosyltransferase involved in cell wall biosynthesis
MSNDAPHILILSSWYPSDQQPFLGNFVRRHAQLLTHQYRVTVVNLICCDLASSNTVTQLQDGSVTEFQAKYPKGSKLTRFRNRKRIFSQALNQVDTVDLIIGHVLLPHGWMFQEASKALYAPFIWVEHGSYFRADVQKRWSTRERFLLISTVSKASAIVSVSEVLKTNMQRIVTSKEIEVIGNHVDDALFTFQNKQPSENTRFLHVSTLDENTKNPKGIIDACALLKKEGLSFEMTIVSDEDATALIEYTSDLGLSSLITFIGPQDWGSMPNFYHQSDAFVLNSDYETFSIVLAESLSTGTPIISTKVGIAHELPEDAVVLSEKNNPESLKNAMAQVIQKDRTFNHEELAKLSVQYHSAQILQRWTKLIDSYVR